MLIIIESLVAGSGRKCPRPLTPKRKKANITKLFVLISQSKIDENSSQE